MVGRIQDIVSASIVAGAAERVGSSPASKMTEQQNTDSVQPAQDMQSTAQYSQYEKLTDEEKLQQVRDAKAAEEAKEEKEAMDERSVSYMTQKLNELMSKINCNLEFQYHKEVNMMSVRMLDKKTQEVLKEVPPEEMLDQMAKTREWLGAFLDKNV